MIHLNIGSNLNSIHGSRFDNISIATNLLIQLNLKIEKISNFYETPSYPNQKLPKFLNIGILGNYNSSCLELLKSISSIPRVVNLQYLGLLSKSLFRLKFFFCFFAITLPLYFLRLMILLIF